jgi:hypothetical protein
MLGPGGGRGELRKLSVVSADGVLWLVVSEREHQEQFEELSLLWAQGSELCLAIVGPPQLRNHLSEGMHAAPLHHTEMVGELATPQEAISFVVKLVLGSSPDNTFQVEVMDEVVAKFWRLEELCSRLERPSASIYDLLLGPPLGKARWANCLDKATK